jgi:hypothetical protein
LRGDEYYRRVREAAKECLDAMFDGQVPMATSAVAAANRIQGIGGGEEPISSTSKSQASSGIFSSVTSTIQSFRAGYEGEAPYQGHPGAAGPLSSNTAGKMNGAPSSASSSYSVGYSGPSSGGPSTAAMPGSSSNLTGIGNPNFKDAREDKSWYQRAASAAASATTSASTLMNLTSKSNASGGLIEEDYSTTYASNRGSNAINSVSYNNAIASNASVVNPGSIGRVGSAASDGAYERTLIQSLTEPSGLKPVPPEDKLQSFMLSINTLSPEIIGQNLLDVLNSDAWQSRVKALIVISKIVKASEPHKTWWSANAVEELSMLQTSDAKVAVRTQASKTLQALGIRSSAPPPVPSANGGSPSASGGPNLLIDDFDGSSIGQLSPMLSASTTPTHQTLGATHSGDLFTGLEIPGGKSSAPAPAPAPVEALPASTASFDFLSANLSSSMPASNPPPPPPTSSYQPQPSSSLLQGNNFQTGNATATALDFLSDMPPPSSSFPPTAVSPASTILSPSSAAPPVSLFDSLNINQSSSTPPVASKPQPTSLHDDLLSLSMPQPKPAMPLYQPSQPYQTNHYQQPRPMQSASVMNMNLATRKDIPNENASSGNSMHTATL